DFTGFGQRLLEVLVSGTAKFRSKRLGLSQVIGHAIKTWAQIAEGGAAANELTGHGDSVVSVAIHGEAPLVELLTAIGYLYEFFQLLLVRVDSLQNLASFGEQVLFASRNRAIEQSGDAGELENGCIGPFQYWIAAGFQCLQPRIGRRELKRRIAHVQDET